MPWFYMNLSAEKAWKLKTLLPFSRSRRVHQVQHNKQVTQEEKDKITHREAFHLEPLKPSPADYRSKPLPSQPFAHTFCLHLSPSPPRKEEWFLNFIYNEVLSQKRANREIKEEEVWGAGGFLFHQTDRIDFIYSQLRESRSPTDRAHG